MNPKYLQFSLLAASVAMVCGAGALWSSKNRDLALRQNQEIDRHEKHASAQQENSRRALSLLKRTAGVDNQLSYRALSQTVAYIGGKSVVSDAKITRAPQHLSIEVLSGSHKGTRNGYSQRWFWRQGIGQKMQPYAEVRFPADAMATKRFPLLNKNYQVSLGQTKKIDGRLAQAVEMRPLRVIDGANGPMRRLWIDQKSGLTLGIESFNCDLRPTSRSMLSKVEIAAVAPKTFERPQAIFASLQTSNWQGEELGDDFNAAKKKTGFVPPRPTYLPPGFELDSYGVHRCMTTGTLQPAAFSRYCDGLNTLTIFAFKPVNANIAKTMRGDCSFGPGAMSSREDNGGRLIAVSDLPVNTLQRVLKSARFETAR